MKKYNKNKEAYGLYWIGKADAFDDVLKPTNKTLLFEKTKSINYKNTNNLYIEGNNTEALKILKKDYKNKIQVIYIDPPYNTGKDFIYKDRYKQSEWCSMIYKSLILSKDLLSEDGVIFISIDDNELCNLKIICDEVFGIENFITQFIYEKTQHFGRQKLNAYSNAEYVLCYAKKLLSSNGKIKELLVEKINSELEDAPLYNASNNITTLTFPAQTVRFKINDGFYNETSSSDYKLLNKVEIKNGFNNTEFSLQFRSRWSQKKITEELKKGTRFIIKSKSFAIRAEYADNKFTKIAPKQIIFTNKKNEYCAYNRFNSQVTTSETAKKNLQELMGECYFPYSKPVSLISYLLSLIYDYRKNEHLKDFTVLDFFSGSATTAQAVIELNALDGGHRNFILIQQPEICSKKSDAHKIGYETICDIGEERIRKCILKMNTETGFKVYKIT